jgi:DNA-binding CsgD family transcriptional regulator
MSESGNQQRPIVGRAQELDAFRAAFDRMLAGRRQVVLISGEPGIGKTRCAEALADMAEDRGALVLWGRCHEAEGAPPYWPWVQILRAYVEASSLDEVRLNMGAAAKEIAALVPELIDSSHQIEPAHSAMAATSAARFRTFDAIRHFFHQATQQVPVTLMLDDLHWADAASLSLLEFLSQELPRSRLLIVATYRDADTSRKMLLSTVGCLSRDSDVQRVHLTGLSQSAIGQLAERLCAVKFPGATIREIFQRTDGNPLFAIELIKVLIEDNATEAEITAMPVRIPAGVRETITRRLVHLSDRCNHLLSVAAVYGRQFAAREIAVATGEDLQAVLSGLEPAVRAGIVQPNTSSTTGSYQFTHELIRETIYEDLPTIDRLRLHGRAGDALVSVHCTHLERVLSRIAYHYYEGASLGGLEKAVAFALRAADSDMRMCAYEEALVHCDRAIKTLEDGGSAHDERLVHAYILKGSALYHLADGADLTALLEAVNRARALGKAALLVDALLLLAMSSRHLEQRHSVPLLQHALVQLPEGDSVERAKALAILAFAGRTSEDWTQLERLVDESVAMAGRCCDAAARCACYTLTVMALRGNPETLERRLQLGQEYVVVARSTGSDDLLAEAYHWQALNYFESGRLEDLECLLQDYESLGTARCGLHQYQVGSHRVALALLRGDWQDLDWRIEELHDIGVKTRREQADGVYGAQMFALNRDLGRLHALEPQIQAIAAGTTGRVWAPGLMLMCAEIGLLCEARVIFDRLADRDCCAIRRDDMYLTCLVFCAETCYALADLDRAPSLYRLLRPYSGQTANHPTAMCFGAVELYLAMLACTAGWQDLAEQHFEGAVARNRAMHAWPSLARTLYRYGTFLVTRGLEAQRRLGHQQLREAEPLARRLGMARLVLDIDTSLHATDESVACPDGLTRREVEILRLLAIGRTNKDVSLVLQISLSTVATHVRSILSKTQCANRTEAAAYAIRHGLQSVQAAAVTS